MDWQTVRSRHILVVLVFVDWRGLVRTGVTNLHPTFVAIVSVVLIMLPVVGIMFHSYMAHHVVHALPDFFCKCPTHINKRSFEVARRFPYCFYYSLMLLDRLSSVVLKASGTVHA